MATAKLTPSAITCGSTDNAARGNAGKIANLYQVPDSLDCVSASGSCWKHASGMTGGSWIQLTLKRRYVRVSMRT